MKKFISGVVSGVILSSAFMFAGPTTITDKNLVDYYDIPENGHYKRYYCYTTLWNIVGNKYYEYLAGAGNNESKFMLSDLKQLELFDEFKVAKQIPQKIEEKNEEIKEVLDNRRSKIQDIAIKMGCVTEDKVKNDNDGYSVTFPNSLKEIYEAILKELDNLK